MPSLDTILGQAESQNQSTIKQIWVNKVRVREKFLLSTCPLDKHYVKFGCTKPKSSCPKSFARNLGI